MGDRTWQIYALPTDPNIFAFSINIWILIILGLTFIAVLVFYVNSLERMVLTRTRDLEKAKLIAEKHAKVKTDFLSVMSHEIRTPMNGVLGMTQILEDTKLDQEQREIIKIINTSGELLLEIINDILDFSKAEAGKLKLKTEIFNFKELCNDLLKVLAFSIEDKTALKIQMKYAENCPVIFLGDNIRLRQILTNFIGNGIKFTKKGSITLQVVLLEQNRNDSQIKN